MSVPLSTHNFELHTRTLSGHTRRGGPRTPSTATDANLDSAFVENALSLFQNLEAPLAPLETPVQLKTINNLILRMQFNPQ